MIVIAQLLSHSVLTLALFFVLLIGTAICTAHVLSPRKKSLPFSPANSLRSSLASPVNTPPKQAPPVNNPSKSVCPGSPSKRVSFGPDVVIPSPSYPSKESLPSRPDTSHPVLKPSPQRATTSTFPQQYTNPPTSTHFSQLHNLGHCPFSDSLKCKGSSFSPPRLTTPFYLPRQLES